MKVSSPFSHFYPEQIRTFYYRTWHKISKYVEFPTQLKKSYRELYGLINYGELRKKIGSNLDEKNGARLSELVFKGHTTVRVKGKTHRLRTPICRALKRLSDKNKQTQDRQTPAVPDQVTIDLRPLTADDFHIVHSSCFQNPYVRLTVRANANLSVVIEHLEKKWRRQNDKLRQFCIDRSSSAAVSSFLLSKEEHPIARQEKEC